MKTNILIILLIASALLNSCSDFLKEDPKSYIAETNYYKTDNDAIGAVNAAYGAIRNEVVNLDFMWLNELTTDDIARGGTAVGEREEIDLLIYNASHNFIKNQWFNCYNCINRANVVLKYVNDGVTPRIKNRVYAEARFLRAWQYFRLVRWFGGIPLKIEPTLNESQRLYPPRASINDVYTLIINDLKFASQNLDLSYSYTDPENGGRATVGAAKSLLGLVYLTMAGQPLNQINYYDSARVVLKDVIDNKAIYGYDLMSNLSDIFDLTKKASNKEAIWYTSGTSGLTSTGWYYTRMHYWFIQYQSLIPTKELWNKTSPVFAFDNPSDLRRKTFIKRLSSNTLLDIDGTSGTPVVAKYVDFEKIADARNDYQHIRYSEVLLNYAETLIELGGSDNLNSAVGIINLFRVRAGVTKYPNPFTGTADDLRTIYRIERRRELMFEGHRWYDLIRWGIFPQTIKIHLQNERGSSLNVDYIGQNQTLFPLPTSEIINNPNIGSNNTGY